MEGDFGPVVPAREECNSSSNSDLKSASWARRSPELRADEPRGGLVAEPGRLRASPGYGCCMRKKKSPPRARFHNKLPTHFREFVLFVQQRQSTKQTAPQTMQSVE